jgi:hypothetical protein
MFQRNMLSPSSGAEATRHGNKSAYTGPEGQGLREGSQSEGGNMGTGCGPIGSHQAPKTTGAFGGGGGKETNICPS